MRSNTDVHFIAFLKLQPLRVVPSIEGCLFDKCAALMDTIKWPYCTNKMLYLINLMAV
jgi:hypothetical protein